MSLIKIETIPVDVESLISPIPLYICIWGINMKDEHLKAHYFLNREIVEEEDQGLSVETKQTKRETKQQRKQ